MMRKSLSGNMIASNFSDVVDAGTSKTHVPRMPTPGCPKALSVPKFSRLMLR
ncbi:Uncharacterised protein [Mycobacteroides abscessus subsp. abscessus]|nr:Uncharacterised protein [Mycobacteroides abscessus subsp. abscessus]